MEKTITLTFKVNKEVKDNLYNFCDAQGLKIGRFLEKAVTHEIERERIKENYLKMRDKAAFQDFEKRRKETEQDFLLLAESEEKRLKKKK